MEAVEPQDVVVYDQSTRDASVLAADSFLSILLSKLDGCFDSVAILTGAFPRPLSPAGRRAGAGAGVGTSKGSRSGSASALLSKPRAQRLLGQWGPSGGEAREL